MKLLIFRSELESAIEKGFSLVQVSVDNGTQFLHTGILNNNIYSHFNVFSMI